MGDERDRGGREPSQNLTSLEDHPVHRWAIRGRTLIPDLDRADLRAELRELGGCERVQVQVADADRQELVLQQLVDDVLCRLRPPDLTDLTERTATISCRRTASEWQRTGRGLQVFTS